VGKTVNMRDVALRAGVSSGTVSHVLNRPEVVKEATRRRVQQAIDELGFVLNGSARQLRAGRSRSIGLVVADVSNPFFTDIARGAESAAMNAGYALILCNSDASADKEQQYLRVLAEHRVQGILITPVGPTSRVLRQIRERGTGVILVDRRAQGTDQCSVAVDDVRGGEMAVRHLLELGHTRLGFVNGPRQVRQCADRRRGVLRALTRAGLAAPTVLKEVESTTVDVQAGEVAATAIMAARPRVSAVFCNNDLMALGLLRGLTRAGARVPDDIAIVGYDDIDFATLAAVPLTSVRQPRYELGRRGTELLLEEADEGEQHRHRRVTFQPELVVRESTVPGAGG
jgi:LacI family transcriptional regulator